MGSQHINIYLKSGRIIENVTVFNCQEFELDEVINMDLIEKVEIYQPKTKNKDNLIVSILPRSPNNVFDTDSPVRRR